MRSRFATARVGVLAAALAWLASGCPGGGDDAAPGDDDAGDDDAADDDAGDDDGGDDDAGDDDGGDDDGGDDDATPFTCEPTATTSPVLAAAMHLDPADPHPGDTLTVIVRSTNGTEPGDAPPMAMQAEHAGGVVLEPTTMVAGGGDTLYYYAIPDVPPGDVCLLGLIDGTEPEIAGKVTVTPRPAGPPLTDGVYKVVQNHQWTCAEQPTYGNEIHVYVRDELGNGVPGAVVRVRYADSTDPGSIHNGGGDIPETVTTDGSGFYLGYDYWPISDHGFLVFQLEVDGEPSDVATELTTGWWEADDGGCNYCGTYGINVWGHWSHTVVFQRDPAATEICVVDTDHAGQAACGAPGHLHHHPTHQACWPVP